MLSSESEPRKAIASPTYQFPAQNQNGMKVFAKLSPESGKVSDEKTAFVGDLRFSSEGFRLRNAERFYH